MDLSFYKDKKVLITGHTGFKGTWLSRILIDAGAHVIGYALKAEGDPSFFDLAKVESQMVSIIGDIVDLPHLQSVFNQHRPEIVFHLAAQPLVRLSYEQPVLTYATNVMGTVNVLECVRHCDSVVSFLNVTTDKVYFNRETRYSYKEEDRLDGYDPYSNSKSCSELVTGSYRNSFFKDRHISISTARSGNVIGGGDFARDRIIPDCAKAAGLNQTIIVRNPKSTRPYQHVLETLRGYLLIAQRQLEEPRLAGAYNIGPQDHDNLETGNLVDLFCEAWGEGLTWETKTQNAVHEAQLLQLDHSKISEVLSWHPFWDAKQAVLKSVEWYKAYHQKADMKEVTQRQIREYFETC